MKVHFTPKETCKLSAAINLISNAVNKMPTKILSSAKNKDSQYILNKDGSSTYEIHEKSFSAFLELGSECLVKVGKIVKKAMSEIKKEAYNTTEELDMIVDHLYNSGQGFVKPEENKVEVKQHPSEDIPKDIRINAAKYLVHGESMSFYKALKIFKISAKELKEALSAM